MMFYANYNHRNHEVMLKNIFNTNIISNKIN
jgi:hypothetical protein